jgi:hypothetical protein
MASLRVGDSVEVRSKEEILRSLDATGRLDGLPFMPQMFQYSGQRFKVYKRAHKTCDTVNGTAGRWLSDGIHLDLRCDGKAYGNCQAACLIFWKEAWLKRVDAGEKVAIAGSDVDIRRNHQPANGALCSEDDVWRATRVQGQRPGEETRYVCQATRLPFYTTRVRWWDIRQYLQDYFSGNVTFGRMFLSFVYAGYSEYCQPGRQVLGPPLRWLYDRFQSLWGGVPYPRRAGKIAAGALTPISSLNLQAGDLVRVKPYEEILATLDSTNKNRGLFFDAEMVPHCGREYRVRSRVNNFLEEKTGKMVTLKTPAVILENVWCQSRYSTCRVFCPRSIYSWWREVWLEKIPETGRHLPPAIGSGHIGSQAREATAPRSAAEVARVDS